MSDPDESYVNIRELLGDVVGQRVVDVVQHDRDEWDMDGSCFFELLFESGQRLRVNIGDDASFWLLQADSSDDRATS